MSGPAVLLLITVVLIVLALVYFLVSTIVALTKIANGLDEAISAVVEIVEKSAPVAPVVDDINANLDAAVSALEGLLVKKAGMEDAVGLVEGLYPGAAAAGFRDFPGSADTKAPRIGEVYTRGTLTLARLGREAPIAAASPAGGPVLRNVLGGSLAARALYPAQRPGRSPVIGTNAPSNTRLKMQTPARFDYERALTIQGAIDSLREHEDSRIVAGGHSLLPMMKLRLAQPSRLIDINDLTELQYIREEGDEILIGALTRHCELLDSELLAARFPAFRDAERVIADPVVRNRGTIGGSLCQADAAEDLSAVCAALKGVVTIVGPDGGRTVPMSEFHLGPWTTAVQADEILTAIRFKVRVGGGGFSSAHEKVERRAGDWAIAAASAAVWLDGNTIADAGIALSAVGMTTVDVTRAEELLRGEVPSDALFEQAGKVASEDCSPIPDSRGPVDYKRHLAGVLTKRALRTAAARALKQEA